MVTATEVHDGVVREARTISAVVVSGDLALRGKPETDALGLVLAPRFIDLHSHCRDYSSRAVFALMGEIDRRLRNCLDL